MQSPFVWSLRANPEVGKSLLFTAACQRGKETELKHTASTWTVKLADAQHRVQLATRKVLWTSAVFFLFCLVQIATHYYTSNGCGNQICACVLLRCKRSNDSCLPLQHYECREAQWGFRCRSRALGCNWTFRWAIFTLDRVRTITRRTIKIHVGVKIGIWTGILICNCIA